MPMRLPILIAIDEHYIRENLRRIRLGRGREFISFPFKFDRHGAGATSPIELIDIEQADYKKFLKPAKEFIESELPTIRSADDWYKKLKYWPIGKYPLLKVILVEWSRQNRIEQFYSGEMDLETAFKRVRAGNSGVRFAGRVNKRPDQTKSCKGCSYQVGL